MVNEDGGSCAYEVRYCSQAPAGDSCASFPSSEWLENKGLYSVTIDIMSHRPDEIQCSMDDMDTIVSANTSVGYCSATVRLPQDGTNVLLVFYTHGVDDQIVDGVQQANMSVGLHLSTTNTFKPRLPAQGYLDASYLLNGTQRFVSNNEPSMY